MIELLHRLTGSLKQKSSQQPIEAMESQYIKSIDSLPIDFFIDKCQNLLLEVNAGNHPMGIHLAHWFPEHLVVSQDIEKPVLKKIEYWTKQSLGLEKIPGNFFYLTGDLAQMPVCTPLAFFSFFPCPNENTVGWLSGAIRAFIAKNPELYSLIVTENVKTGITSREKNVFSCTEPLKSAISSHAIEMTTSSVDFDDILKRVPTHWCHQLGNMYKEAHIIEINSHKRSEFMVLSP